MCNTEERPKRILRLTALLLIAAGACAQDSLDEAITWSSVNAPYTHFAVTVKNSNGTVENRLVEQPDVLSMAEYRSRNTYPLAKKILGWSDDYGPCYFIRSYVMHRDDDTEAMHLDHVTTCTPMSRFQMKKTQRVPVVPALEH